MFSQDEGESYRDFPIQRPTAANHGLWLCAIGSLVVLGHKLCHPLGKYITDPHLPDVWFTLADQSEIYRQETIGVYKIYQHKRRGRKTRYAPGIDYRTVKKGHARDWCVRAFKNGMVSLCGFNQQHAQQQTTSDHEHREACGRSCNPGRINPCGCHFILMVRIRNGSSGD